MMPLIPRRPKNAKPYPNVTLNAPSRINRPAEPRTTGTVVTSHLISHSDPSKSKDSDTKKEE